MRARLEEIRAAFPSTRATTVKFAVLSSLAEGGDRLVAKEAFATLTDAGVSLHVVLPMSAGDYAEDFPTADSQREFEQLLGTAAVTTQLPEVGDRNEAYERAGHYVVDNSDILIALWDGRPQEGRGGTAAIVEYARDQEVPVLVVPVARAAKPDRAPEDGDVAIAQPAARSGTFEAYRRVEEFNCRSSQELDLTTTVAAERQRLSRVAHGAETRARCEPIAAWALPLLARADRLALRYQRRYLRSSASLYLLAAFAVTVVAAQSQAKWSPRVALAEVASMLAVLAVYAITRWRRLRDRWLDYRSLAEALRSSLFIAVSGLQIEDVRGSLEGTVAVQGPWFQRAFSTAWEERPEVAAEVGEASRLRRFLLEGWLDHQVDYHWHTIKRLKRTREMLTRAVFVLFAVTILAGVLHAFELLDGPVWGPVLLFLAVALPGFGAALAGIRDLRQYRIHEHRCARTAARLERLRDRVADATDPPSVQRIAAQIQSAIEAESADWSSVVEFQDLEVVV